MSLNLECDSNLNVTQIGTSLKLKFHSNWNVTQLECHSNLNITQIKIALKYEFYSNWNVTKIGILLKFLLHSNWKTKWIEKVVTHKTSNSASIGQISI